MIKYKRAIGILLGGSAALGALSLEVRLNLLDSILNDPQKKECEEIIGNISRADMNDAFLRMNINPPYNDVSQSIESYRQMQNKVKMCANIVGVTDEHTQMKIDSYQNVLAHSIDASMALRNSGIDNFSDMEERAIYSSKYHDNSSIY